MKIALIGATGKIGQEIAKEILQHQHSLTVLTRSNKTLPTELAGAQQKVVDILDVAALTEAVRGHDVIASAYGPDMTKPIAMDQVAETARALIAAARAAGVKRVVVIGGAGSLEVAPGVQLVDIPEFPAAYKPVALAHREAFNIYRSVTDLDWTFFAPAAMIAPGEKKGNYRVGEGKLLTDAAGNSAISYCDYAEAFAAELEQGTHRKAIITVAYN
ncbi:MAG: NAD(P)H-binding protein [Formivibrio sp.]|nr:NAD(P)H-binding protein [Formivibrio sp.]